MEYQSDVSSPMSDEMVDDLLNNFLKNVDDDDTSSPVDQRTDEEGGTVMGDGLTSGSDAKQSDGFHSPQTLPSHKTTITSSPNSKPHTGNSSSFEDDEGTGSLSSNNVNGGQSGGADRWFPSAAAQPGSLHGMPSLPGMMVSAGFERSNGPKRQQTSSDDSDSADKVPNRHGGLRSPHNANGRSAHPAPRAGLDVLRNPGTITQQWPPQTSSTVAGSGSASGYPGRRTDPPPPAYAAATTTNATWATAPGVFASASRHATTPPASLAGTPPDSAAFRVQPASTQLFQQSGAARPTPTPTSASSVASPSSFIDPQFFAAPGSYGGHGVAGMSHGTATPPIKTPAAAAAAAGPQPPYVMMLPQGTQPGAQQAPLSPYNPEQTVMLTMAQLSALLQQPQQSQNAFNAASMVPQNMPFSTGFPQPSTYQPRQPVTSTNPVFMVFPSAQNGGTQGPSANNGGAIHYSLPAPLTNLFAAPTGNTSGPGMLPTTATHMSHYGAAPPPQYTGHTAIDLHHSAVPVRRVHEDNTDRRTGAGPPQPDRFLSEHAQAANNENLPRPPWQLPRPTTTRDNNGSGGDRSGEPTDVRSPANAPVCAWVRRNGRWQPLMLELG